MAMHHTQLLATRNGEVAFESGRPVDASNPYKRASKSFVSFRRGWHEAERVEALIQAERAERSGRAP